MTSDETNDFWFVDNILVHDGPNLTQDPLVRGAIFENDLFGLNPGQSVAYVASLTGGGELGSGVGPSFFGGAVTLDVLAPLYNLGVAQVWTQALALEPNLADSTTSNVVTQIVQ